MPLFPAQIRASLAGIVTVATVDCRDRHAAYCQAAQFERSHARLFTAETCVKKRGKPSLNTRIRRSALSFLLTPAPLTLPRPAGVAVFPTSDDDWNAPQIFAAVRRAALDALPALPSLAHEEVSHLFPEGRLNTELVGSTAAIVFFTRNDDACKACQEVRIRKSGTPDEIECAGCGPDRSLLFLTLPADAISRPAVLL